MVKWLRSEDALKIGDSEERVLFEQTPDHVPEFGRFLRTEIGRAGGSLYFEGPSGSVYRIGLVESRGAIQMGGVEIAVRTSLNGVTVTRDKVDGDLWPLLEWLVEGAGAPWKVNDLRTTGAIYQIPGAPERG